MKRASTLVWLGILTFMLAFNVIAQGLQSSRSVGRLVIPIGLLPSPPAACVAAPSGIVAWWPAESNAMDIVGGNNGVATPGVNYGAGEVGDAFQLDGDAYVLVNPSSSNLDVGQGGGFTVEGWINPETLDRQMPIVEYERVLGSYDGADVGVHFYINLPPDGGTGPGCLFANVADTTGASHYVTSAPGLLVAGSWQHVALTYDETSGIATIYLNGSVVAQQTVGSLTPQTSFGNFLIGARTAYGSAGQPSDYFSGGIDELSVYGRALSANEITGIYNAGGAGKCHAVCVPPPSGIVGWWPAESNTVDVIGGHNGILLNGAGYGPGEVGTAFSFTTTNGGVRIPASPSLDVGTGNGMTVEGWINPADLTQRGEIVEWNSGNMNQATAWGVHLQILAPGEMGLGAGNLFSDVHGADGTVHWIMAPGGTITQNVFQHVALTYDKTSGLATLYCNGAIVAQQNLGQFTPLTSYDLYIGRRPASYSIHSFLGSIDEISVYNRALSPDEIAAIYNAGSAGKCSVESLLPYIVTPPASQTVTEGGEVDLSVAAGGVGTLGYQWLYDGKKISGATSDALSLPNIHPSQAGNYSVKVTDTYGSVTSSPAMITVTTQSILMYSYSGSEKITTLGSETTYGYSGEMFFIPATTNAIFVGWANIGGKRQYWVSQDSDYLWIKVAGSAGHSYTVLGLAGSGLDVNGAPHLWSALHQGQNANLLIATRKTFPFPNTMAFSETQVYPDEQSGNMVLRVAASNYSFMQGNTQTVNDHGETVNDLVSALVASLTKQGYKPQ